MRPSEILRHLLSYQGLDTKIQELYGKEPVSVEIVNAFKNHLVELEGLFKGSDKVWLERYNYLKEESKLPAVVKISRNYIGRNESFACECGLELSKVKIYKAEEMEEIVTCEYCGRIIYSEIKPSIQKITEKEIKNGFLRLPPHLDLHYNLGEKFNLLDFWDEPWPVLVENNCLVELGPLFDKYSLEPEDYIFIYKLPDEESKFRLIPELISESDKTKILLLLELENAGRHIDLSEIIDSVLSKEVEIFGYLLIKGELLKLLQEDSQFEELLNKVIEKRKIPSKMIEIPSKEQEKVVVRKPQLTIIQIKFKLTKEALKRGYLIVGKNLRYVFESYDKHGYITIVTHVDKESKATFFRNKWSINGLSWFYRENQLEIGDSVYLKIEDATRRKFRLYTDWKREPRRAIANVDYSKKDLPKKSPISPKKIDSIREDTNFEEIKSPETKEKLKKTIAEIEINDLVYKTLKKQKRDLFYTDIASIFEDMFNVDQKGLVELLFLNPQDKRLFRNENGSWTLKEFVEKPKEIETPTLSNKKFLRSNLINRNNLIISILLIFLVVFVIFALLL